MDGQYGNMYPPQQGTGMRTTEEIYLRQQGAAPYPMQGQGMPQNMGQGMADAGRTQYLGTPYAQQPAGQMRPPYPGQPQGYMQPGNMPQANIPPMMPGNMPQANTPPMMPGNMPQANIPPMMPGNVPQGNGPVIPQGNVPRGNGPVIPQGNVPTMAPGAAHRGNVPAMAPGAAPSGNAPAMAHVNAATAPPVKQKSNKGLIIFLLCLLGVLLAGGVVALILLTAGNKEILPSKTSATIAVGEELVIRIDNFDDDLSDVRLNYESADTQIVTVVREYDDALIIKGVGEGETELTISGSGCRSVKIPVTVLEEGDSGNE